MALIWLQAAGLAVALPLAVEGGYRLHHWTKRSSGTVEDDGWAPLVAGAVTLLGLLLAFTVSMATDRFEARRRLVIDEANAISTTYLRARAFEGAPGAAVRAAILDYASSRRLAYLAGENPSNIDAVERANDRQRDRIWATTLVALGEPDNARMTTSMLQATNEMFDIAATRQAAVETRVPPSILLSLVAYAIVTAVLSGYGLANHGARHAIASTLLFLMVAALITLVLDLDHPRSGAVRVSQSPLERVAISIAAAEGAK